MPTKRSVALSFFAATLLVGVVVGSYAASRLIPTANAVVLLVTGGVLLLSNLVVRSLNEAFSENLNLAKNLEAGRYAAFVSYVSSRRIEVNMGYIAANIGGALCEISAPSQFAESYTTAIPANVQTILFVAAYAASISALPFFLRSVNYWRLLDRFRYEIETLVADQARRKERLASMPRMDHNFTVNPLYVDVKRADGTT